MRGFSFETKIFENIGLIFVKNMMKVLIVRLSKAHENGVCNKALSLQGFDYVQPDKNTLLKILYFYITSLYFYIITNCFCAHTTCVLVLFLG